MKNEIESIRQDILKYFELKELIPDSYKKVFSPDNKYYFIANSYKQTDPARNWEVTKIEIYQTQNEKKLFEFIRDESFICYCWLNVNNSEYFICPEDFEGQSIYNITTNQFYSFSTQKDPFIWTEIFPSPDKTKIAVSGCFWAYPFELVIYDISDICSLPYPVMIRRTLESEKPNYWKNNSVFVLKDKENEIFFDITG